jgi:hypothetical protein
LNKVLNNESPHGEIWRKILPIRGCSCSDGMYTKEFGIPDSLYTNKSAS